MSNEHVKPILDMFHTHLNIVQELDEKTEPGASGRKALNELVATDHNAVYTARSFVQAVLDADEGDREVMAQILLREGSKVFKGIVDAYVDANSSETVELSEDEKNAIAVQREAALQAARGLQSALKAMLPEDEFNRIPNLPRKKTMGGKRIKGYFSYTIDGVDAGHLSNKELAGRVGAKGTALVSAALEQAGLDPSALPDVWSLSYKNHSVMAERVPEPADAPVESDEDEDEEI